jgi:hypothetical protein
MRCSKAREYISDALDERLDERRGLQLAAHLESCDDCLRHQNILQRSQAILAREMVEPADNFEWKVQLKIQQALREKAAPREPIQGWAFWRPTLVSAVSVALVVVAAGGLLLREGGPANSVRPLAESVRTQPVASSVAEAEPDLSGGVRTQPLRINAANGGFGIRTVADVAVDDQLPFGELHPRWRQQGGGEELNVHRMLTEDGVPHFVVERRVLYRGRGLNLQQHRSRLQEFRGVADSTPNAQDPDS